MNTPGLFVDADAVPPEEQRDPRGKPYLLMDDDDKRRAIRYAAYHDTNARIEVSGAVSVLDGKPQRTSAKQLLRDIGTTDGFDYRPGRERRKTNADGVLRITDRDAVETSADHHDLQPALGDPDADTPEVDATDADDEPDGDVSNDTDDLADDHAEVQADEDGNTPLAPSEADAVIDELPIDPSDLPDPVVRKTIAEVTNDTVERDDSGTIVSRLLEAVTDDEIAYVRDYADPDAEEPGTPDANPGGSTAETTIQRPDNAADDMDKITSGDPVRADGGTPEVDTPPGT